MRKHLCPYLDSQNRCTHKYYGRNKKPPACIHSNALKCKLYNEWLNKKRLIREPVNEDETLIRKWVKDMERRWNK